LHDYSLQCEVWKHDIIYQHIHKLKREEKESSTISHNLERQVRNPLKVCTKLKEALQKPNQERTHIKAKLKKVET